MVYSLIAFYKRVTFSFNASSYCLVYVCMLHFFACEAREFTITQSYRHTMQQTHMHKAVPGHVEAKKVTLSSKTIRLQYCSILVYQYLGLASNIYFGPSMPLLNLKLSHESLEKLL